MSQTPRHQAPLGLTISLSLTLLAAGNTTACGEDFRSRTSLSEYSILGIETSLPEVAPRGSLQITAHDYSPGNQDLSYRWSLCPYSLGADLAYECAEGVAEVELSRQASFQLELGSQGIDLTAILDAAGTRPGVDGRPRTLEVGFNIWLRLISGPDCEGCRSIESVKRLVIRQNETSSPNQNPEIQGFDVIGDTKTGATVRLQVNTDSPEHYTDLDLAGQRTEEFLYTWYTTKGQAEPNLTFGDTRETELKLPDEAGPMEVMVAVRDGRGGMALARQMINVSDRVVGQTLGIARFEP